MFLLDWRWTWIQGHYGVCAWWLMEDLPWWYDRLAVMPGWIVLKARIVQ